MLVAQKTPNYATTSFNILLAGNLVSDSLRANAGENIQTLGTIATSSSEVLA